MNNTVLERLKQEYNETLNRMQDLGDILAHCAEMDTNHCGQDAKEEAHVSLNELLGMEVMFVFPHCHKCGDCTFRKGADGSECPCVKVELVGGDYICLAGPEQDKEPITGLDEDERKVFEHNGMCDIDRRVNERNSLTYQDAFSDAVRDIKANGATNHSCPFAVLQAQREMKDAETIKRMHGVSKALTDYVGRIIGKDRQHGLG